MCVYAVHSACHGMACVLYAVHSARHGMACVLYAVYSAQHTTHTTHTPFHDMSHNRIINNDVISPNVLT